MAGASLWRPSSSLFEIVYFFCLWQAQYFRRVVLCVLANRILRAASRVKSFRVAGVALREILDFTLHSAHFTICNPGPDSPPTHYNGRGIGRMYKLQDYVAIICPAQAFNVTAFGFVGCICISNVRRTFDSIDRSVIDSQ